LERLLDVAGPVPWTLKAALYQRLLPDPAWHRANFRSLLVSRFAAYGQIDAPSALTLLNQLRLTHDTQGLANLRTPPASRGRRASAPAETSLTTAALTRRRRRLAA
jgi:hypothetical protein